jgi:ribonuclease HII
MFFKATPFRWKSLKSQYVIGLDEVGRGCLAGSVYAAAVLIEKNQKLPRSISSQVTDSKLLSPLKRQALSNLIRENLRYGIGFATVREIEEMNIHFASLLAMKRAFENLRIPDTQWSDCHLLIDGNKKIKTLDVQQTCVIKGDLRALPIGAASIIAKVERDQELVHISQAYPGYGFENHKGYGTKTHKKALARLGVTDIHRRTFSGVKELLAP